MPEGLDSVGSVAGAYQAESCSQATKDTRECYVYSGAVNDIFVALRQPPAALDVNPRPGVLDYAPFFSNILDEVGDGASGFNS